jgi:beta-lactam-binding protein with PASTA domain
VTVPGVVGMAKADAVEALEDWDLPATVSTIVAPGVTPGTVLAQDPAPGTVVVQGTPVLIAVAVGEPEQTPTIVPVLLGMRVDDATGLLRAMGLAPVIVDQWQCNPPDLCRAQQDLVWFQDPPGGTQLAPGSAVLIRVNRGDEGYVPPSPSPGPSPTPSASPSGP